MPVFEYTALDSRGKTTSGIIDAEGAQAARQKLRTSGIFPVSIKETLEAAPKKAPRVFTLTRRLGRVKPVEVSMMTRQLATLIGAVFHWSQPWMHWFRRPNPIVLKKYWPKLKT